MNEKPIELLEEPRVKIATKRIAGGGMISGKRTAFDVKMKLPYRIMEKFRRGHIKYYGPEIAVYNGRRYLLHGICSFDCNGDVMPKSERYAVDHFEILDKAHEIE